MPRETNIDGLYRDTLRVSRDTVLRGTAAGGVHVQAGCRLTVHGVIQGTVTVDENAVLILYGTMWPGLPNTWSGDIYLAGNTVIGTELVTETGQRRPLVNHEKVTLRHDKLFRITPKGSFLAGTPEDKD